MDRVGPQPDDTAAIYDRQAEVFDAERSRSLFEARWLARFAAQLPPGGQVLDLGCGAGAPIAQWFLAEGFAVTGVDFSDPLLAMARTRWPQATWHLADMRTLDLGRRFDGIIAWHSLFHLPPEAQRACIARIAQHLTPTGALMFTAGPRADIGSGQVGSDRVYHASLSPAGYATCLEQNGLHMTGFLADDPKTQGATIITARKD